MPVSNVIKTAVPPPGSTSTAGGLLPKSPVPKSGPPEAAPTGLLVPSPDLQPLQPTRATKLADVERVALLRKQIAFRASR